MSSPRPPALRQINRAVGAFVLVGALIVVATTLQASRLQRWFDPGDRLMVRLPREGSFGLRERAEVRMLGTSVGSVVHIKLDESGRMTALTEIRSEFASLVRADSKALIKKTFGVAGDSYLDISRGTTAPTDLALISIEARPDEAPTEAIQQVVQELKDRAFPLIEEVRGAIKTWTDVGARLNDPDGQLRKTLVNIEGISEKINDGRGVVGKLLSDDELAEHFRSVVFALDQTIEKIEPVLENLNKVTGDTAEIVGTVREEVRSLPGSMAEIRETVARLRELLGDLKEVSKQLPTITRDVKDAAAGVPALVLQAQSTLLEAEEFLQGLQRHWLFRDSMAPEASDEALRPEEALP